MFKLLSNKGIKISQGDESRWFSWPINLGTKLDPEYVIFENELIISDQTSNILLLNIDNPTFKTKVGGVEGKYVFAYSLGTWKVNGQTISSSNLDAYGITYSLPIGTSTATFTITYTNRSDLNITFYLFKVNDTTNDWQMKKEFACDGKVTLYKHNWAQGESYPEPYLDIIDAFGNLQLKFDQNDTTDLEPGEYRFALRSTFIDPQTNEKRTATVTNKLQFHLINDDYDRGRFF